MELLIVWLLMAIQSVGGAGNVFSNQLRIEDNILTKSRRPLWLASIRHFVTLTIHETIHVGTNKTYALLKDRFYWPNMYKFLQQFTTTCSVCQRTKHDTQAPKAPLLPLHIPQVPMELVSIDIAVLPQDDGGFIYMLVIGHISLKHTQGVPMRGQHATTVCRAFRGIVNLKHGSGSPYFLLSDQGLNVHGNLIHERCSIINIKKRRSSACHSEGNGFAEGNIENIREVLRALLLDRDLPLKAVASSPARSGFRIKHQWELSHTMHTLLHSIRKETNITTRPYPWF